MGKIELMIKKKLESLLTDVGYVLDFSNNSFQDFVLESIEEDIYDKKYDYYGDSKAKRLFSFWHIASIELSAKLNIDLLEYWRLKTTLEEFNENSHIYEDCKNYFNNILNGKGQIINTNILQKVNTSILSHKFIEEQIKKGKIKIQNKDYSGAITNARTLLEQVLMELVTKLKISTMNKGNLLKLYKEVSKKMNLDAINHDVEGLKQILSGLNSIINGIANLRNVMSDSHARKLNPSLHHAKLALNSSQTICDFLLDSYQFQVNKVK